MPEITVEQKEAYYQRCNNNALNDSGFLAFWHDKLGFSVDLIKKYNIGIDVQANPAKAPWGVGFCDWSAKRIIFPVNENYYSAFAPYNPDYRFINPTGSRVDIWNKETLWEGHPFVAVTESVLDALSIIECGGFAIALNGDSARILKESLQNKRTQSQIVLCLGDHWSGENAEKNLENYLSTHGIATEIRGLCNGFKSINERLRSAPDKLKSEITSISDSAETVMRNSGRNLMPQSQQFEGHTCRSTLEAGMVATIFASGSVFEYEPEHYETSNGHYLIDCKVHDVVVVNSDGNADVRTIIFEGKGVRDPNSISKPQDLSKDVSTFIWGEYTASGGINEIKEKFETCYFSDRRDHLALPSFSFAGITGNMNMAFPYISERGLLTLADPEIMFNQDLLGRNTINEWATMVMYGVSQQADWSGYNSDRKPEYLANEAKQRINTYRRDSIRLYGS